MTTTKTLTDSEIEVLKRKPVKDLTLAEQVFLQGLRINELERKVTAMASAVFHL